MPFAPSRMSEYASDIEKKLGVEIVVVGFNVGSGLPESCDPRDLKYFWSAGVFPMDNRALQARLAGRVELVIGNVATICQKWMQQARSGCSQLY